MLNPNHPVARIPLTIATVICIAPIFLIVEGSAWIRRRRGKQPSVASGVFEGLTDEDFRAIREHPLARKLRGEHTHPPCFRCSVNGLKSQCPWCQKRAKNHR